MRIMAYDDPQQFVAELGASDVAGRLWEVEDGFLVADAR
jgi:hypothetical protein